MDAAGSVWIGARSLSVPYGSVISTLAVMLVPLGAGMWMRVRNRDLAHHIERAGSLAGIGVLVLLMVTGIVRNGHLLVQTSVKMYVAAIALGHLGMGLGYVVARLTGLDRPARRSVAFETGIQNSPLTLAIIVASFDDGDPFEIMWLPLLYALFVLISASVVTLILRWSDA